MHFEGIQRGQNVHTLVGPDLLFYLSEEFCTTERKILNASICLFQPFGKIKIAGSYWDDGFPLIFET